MNTPTSLIATIDDALADYVTHYGLEGRGDGEYLWKRDFSLRDKASGTPFRISHRELVTIARSHLDALAEELKGRSGRYEHTDYEPDSIDAAIRHAQSRLDGYVDSHVTTCAEIDTRMSRVDSSTKPTGIVATALVSAGIGLGINGGIPVPAGIAYIAAAAVLAAAAAYLTVRNSGPIRGGLDEYRRNFIAGFNAHPQQPRLFS